MLGNEHVRFGGRAVETDRRAIPVPRHSSTLRAGISPYLDHALRVADPFHVVRVRREAPCFRGRVRDPPLRAVAAVR
jgi:hypothetical protein